MCSFTNYFSKLAELVSHNNSNYVFRKPLDCILICSQIALNSLFHFTAVSMKRNGCLELLPLNIWEHILTNQRLKNVPGFNNQELPYMLESHYPRHDYRRNAGNNYATMKDI